jgi:maleylacetoacetate isomerase
MKLYSYFRSSASYRVRIALALKGVSYDYAAVHLLRGGGQQLSLLNRELNADGLVPTLETGHNLLTQSLAIIEYLEEEIPEPRLLPKSPLDRAHVRSVALQIACEIHPLNNFRVLQYLKDKIGVSDEQKSKWYRHWIELGFASLETRLASDKRTGTFVFGDTPSLADILLVPQVWNARRFEILLSAYPTIERLTENARKLDAFKSAEPSNQPDAE